jgi:hypothetical protein
MLGTRSPQRGLFEADTQYRRMVPESSFYAFLAEHRGELFRDDAFAALYTAKTGRPSVPPSLLATALVLQAYDGVSDAEARDRATYDLRWKIALGIELETRPFAKSTLQEFRAQLIVHEQQAAIFQDSLALAKRQGKFTRERQITLALDTTTILGRGAVKDTYNLLADGIVLVLRVLAQQAGETLAVTAEREGLTRYVTGASLKGEAAIDWDDRAARQRFLGEIVADADRLLEVVRTARAPLMPDSPEDRALAGAAGVLSRILQQDIERPDEGPNLRQGVARDRLVAVHDPEMRHGRKSARKRFDGHKADIAVDTETQLITAVAVLPGNAPDHDQALALVEASEAATGTAVAETLGDCAFGDGATRQAFGDAGRPLIATVPALTNQGRYPKTDFAIDLEARTCTCPAGQTTAEFRPAARGGGTFRFAASLCAVCPLQAQCRRGRAGRTVAVHPQEGLLQQARHLQAQPAFRAYRTQRQVVEHRIARLVQLGLRQARYVGRTKTLFQLLMVAAVANFTRLAAMTSAISLLRWLRSVLQGIPDALTTMPTGHPWPLPPGALTRLAPCPILAGSPRLAWGATSRPRF